MSRHIFLIAGEESGDLLGAALMKDMKQLMPDARFSGIGGAQMSAEGLQSVFPMSDLSVMGIVDVFKHLPILVKRFYQTIAAIKQQKPDLLVTIDAPDFCFRIAKKIKQQNPSLKIVHMVAPTVWAWRPGRAKKIAQFLDGILCLYPFEPRYFSVHGLKAQFMGHPLEKIVAPVTQGEKQDFFGRYHLNSQKPLLCLLPGSRTGEITAMLPLFLKTVDRLKDVVPDLQVILPTLPHKLDMVKTVLGSRDDIHVFVPETAHDKYIAFAASTVALHTSGTVALELALCGTPMVTTYKVGPVSAFIAHRLIKTPFINLANILLSHPVVPELIQERANVTEMTAMTQALLTNPGLYDLQREQLLSLRSYLEENAPQTAAHFVQSYLN